MQHENNVCFSNWQTLQKGSIRWFCVCNLMDLPVYPVTNNDILEQGHIGTTSNKFVKRN